MHYKPVVVLSSQLGEVWSRWN